jgi:hypothetical protein
MRICKWKSCKIFVCKKTYVEKNNNKIEFKFKNYNKNNIWCAYTNVRIIPNNHKNDKNVYASIYEKQNM